MGTEAFGTKYNAVLRADCKQTLFKMSEVLCILPTNTISSVFEDDTNQLGSRVLKQPDSDTQRCVSAGDASAP